MKFSIITPTWNCESSVIKTVKSVRLQQGVDIEHILIDNCSTDRTIENALSVNSELKVFSEKDTGIYNAFNKGLKRTTGDIIAFLNADDFYVDEQVFTKVAEIFNNNSEVSCVYGNIFVNSTEYKPRQKGLLSIKGNRLFHPAVFMKKWIFEDLNGFDESFEICGDLDLFIKAKNKGFKFFYIDDILANFALGGVSTEKLFKTTSEIIQVLQKNEFSKFYIASFAIQQYTKDLLNFIRKSILGVGK
jgi:glycosyltransferase involved in cell wall biosynthesis